jgi:hypothetical protein
MRTVAVIPAHADSPEQVVVYDGRCFLLDAKQPVSPAYLVEMERRGLLEWSQGVNRHWVEQAELGI